MQNKEIYIQNKDFIEEVLGGFYDLNMLQTSGFEILDKDQYRYRIYFDFLPYKKVKNSLLGHVSANQIHEGIMEGLYLVTGNFIKAGEVEGVSFDDFLEIRAIALFREFYVKYKKEIQHEYGNSLDFDIKNYKDIKGKFSTIEINFQGFCTGGAKLVIGTGDLISNTLDNV